MWEINFEGRIEGPFSTETLRRMAAEGRINADTPVRAVGDSAWRAARELDLGEDRAPFAPSELPDDAALESLRGRAAWARGLLWAMLLVAAASVAESLVMAEFLERVETNMLVDEQRTIAEADRLDAVGGLIAIVYVICFIGVAILYLSWKNRAVRNARLVDPEVMKISPGWAVGWNFVPIAFLFMPHRAIRQLWRVSFAGPSSPARSVEIPGHVAAWWLCWVGTNLLGNVSTRIYLRPDPSLLQLKLATWADVAGETLMVIACLLLLRIVGAVTEAQLRWRGTPAVERMR